MFGNLFHGRKDKKREPIRASFRPTLEPLGERIVPGSLQFYTGGQTSPTSLAGGQPSATGGGTSTTQGALYLQALMSASPTQLASIENDMVTAGTAAIELMSAGSATNSTTSSPANLMNLWSQYTQAVFGIINQMSNLVQSSSSSANSTTSPGTGGATNPTNALSAILPNTNSSSSQAGQANANPLLTNGSAIPSGSGLYVA